VEDDGDVIDRGEGKERKGVGKTMRDEEGNRRGGRSIRLTEETTTSDRNSEGGIQRRIGRTSKALGLNK